LSVLYIQELAYLDNLIIVIVISIAVESKVNYLLRMRQKFPEKKNTLVVGKIGHAVGISRCGDALAAMRWRRCL
jgi:hypothetical protein